MELENIFTFFSKWDVMARLINCFVLAMVVAAWQLGCSESVDQPVASNNESPESMVNSTPLSDGRPLFDKVVSRLSTSVEVKKNWILTNEPYMKKNMDEGGYIDGKGDFIFSDGERYPHPFSLMNYDWYPEKSEGVLFWGNSLSYDSASVYRVTLYFDGDKLDVRKIDKFVRRTYKDNTNYQGYKYNDLPYEMYKSGEGSHKYVKEFFQGVIKASVSSENSK